MTSDFRSDFCAHKKLPRKRASGEFANLFDFFVFYIFCFFRVRANGLGAD